MTFPLAPMNRPIRIMTFLLLLLLAVIAGGAGVSAAMSPDAWVGIPVVAFIVLIVAGVYVFARPTAFVITATQLLILFPGRKREIPLADITGVELLDKDALKGTIRLFGAGGLWGGFGLMWSRRIGTFDAYVSTWDGLVRLDRRAARPLIITPADAQAFAAKIRETITPQA